MLGNFFFKATKSENSNCTRNHLITYPNNKALLIAKSPETLHFPDDYLQQQRNNCLRGTGLVAEKLVNLTKVMATVLSW